MAQFQALNPLGALAGVQGAVSQGQTIRQQRQQNRLSELMEPYKMQQAQMQQERMRMSNQQLQGAISDEDRVRLGRDAQLYVELFGPDLPETLEEADAQWVATELGRLSDLRVYPRSITAIQNSLLFLGRRDNKKYLGVLSQNGDIAGKFEGEANSVTIESTETSLKVTLSTAANAAA